MPERHDIQPFVDEILTSYTSDQAENDGILVHIKEVTSPKNPDMKWYFTQGVWGAIEDVNDGRTMEQKYLPFLQDCVMALNAALKKNKQEYLVSDGLEGNVTGEKVWMAQNETGGWTIMFPSEY